MNPGTIHEPASPASLPDPGPLVAVSHVAVAVLSHMSQPFFSGFDSQDANVARRSASQARYGRQREKHIASVTREARLRMRRRRLFRTPSNEIRSAGVRAPAAAR